MNILRTFKKIFTKQLLKSAPLLIIKQDTDQSNVQEYNSVEEAIADLENDPNVSSEKVAKLRLSLKNLKNKTSIKIKNGEIVK